LWPLAAADELHARAERGGAQALAGQQHAGLDQLFLVLAHLRELFAGGQAGGLVGFLRREDHDHEAHRRLLFA